MTPEKLAKAISLENEITTLKKYEKTLSGVLIEKEKHIAAKSTGLDLSHNDFMFNKYGIFFKAFNVEISRLLFVNFDKLIEEELILTRNTIKNLTQEFENL